MSEAGCQSGTVLIVEDDPNDVFFLKLAFEAARLDNPLQVVGDGQEALDYLAGKGKYADRAAYPFPCLVLLDLKLPVKLGLDVLREIRGDPQLSKTMIIVLTSSSNAADIDEAYQLGAHSYLIKPVSIGQREEMARLIKEYWLGLNRGRHIPRRPPGECRWS